MFGCSIRYLLLLALMFAPAGLEAAEILGPHVEVREQGVYVNTGIVLNERQLNDIHKGISKEIDIYVDLYRVWKAWPDEFVSGRKITRTIKCDPIKKEFVATSLLGYTLREKRFSNCEELLKWALAVQSLKLTGTNHLARAPHFVKVTVEGRLRRLPSVMSYFLFFVKEIEYTLKQNSVEFRIRKTGDQDSG